MKMFRLLPLVGSLAAAPAFATGGFTCTVKDDPDLRLSIVTGMAPGIVIAQARLQQGGALRATTDEGARAMHIAQSWVDDSDLRLDLVDADHMGYVARLTSTRDKFDKFAGTLTVDGRAHPAVCTSEH